MSLNHFIGRPPLSNVPCITCGTDTLHRGRRCVHCNTDVGPANTHVFDMRSQSYSTEESRTRSFELARQRGLRRSHGKRQ